MEQLLELQGNTFDQINLGIEQFLVLPQTKPTIM